MNEPIPELDDIQQLEEPAALIEVPVRVVDMGAVQAHLLPARDAVLRSVTVSDNVQLLMGKDMRRKCVTVWATSATANGHVFIGVDKSEVESETCARLPAMVDTLVSGPPMVLTMTHYLPLWVKNTTVNPVTVSFAVEYWAD